MKQVLFTSNFRKCFIKILSVILVIALTVCILNVFSRVTERKSSLEKYNAFFEEKKDYDVFFVGNSHMLNAVMPQELWNSYGITSYNIAGQANTIETSYWTLRNAMEYHTPKMVVIDGFGSMFGDNKTSTAGVSYVHLSMDAFPLSLTKIAAICDLMDDPGMEKLIENGEVQEERGRNVISFLWDFSVYHSRWDSLNSSDYNLNYSTEKGAESLAQVAVPAEHPEYSSDYEPLAGTNLGADYLRRMIEELQKQGIIVVLTYMPFPATELHIRECNTLKQIAQEYGCDFYNFLELDVINYETDLADANAHVNTSGATKITTYLGKMLQTDYPGILINHKDDALYSNWYEEYEDYISWRINQLKSTNDASIYLTLLKNGWCRGAVWHENKETSIDNSTLQKYIDNLDNFYFTDTERTNTVELSEKDIYIEVYLTNGEIIDTVLLRYQSADDWTVEHL